MTRTPKQTIDPTVRNVWTSGPSGHILPATLGRIIRARPVGGVVVLEAVGRLGDVLADLDRAARLALAEEPRGVVCDLSRVVEVNAPGALRELALSGRHPRDWPGVPLAIGGLGRRGGETLSLDPMGRHLMVNTSLRQALSMVLQASLPAVRSLQLAPHPTAPRASRDFVTRTLLGWKLSKRIPDACLMVSELVTNAMIHAGSDIELTVSEHRQAIRVAVRDHSPDLPVERPGEWDGHGLGLKIIATLSSGWGVLPHPDGGKVVWATLDLPRSAHMTSR